MEVSRTSLPGVLLIQPRVFHDERGFFLETWNEAAFEQAGIPSHYVQDNLSCSKRGVLEAALPTCWRGSVNEDFYKARMTLSRHRADQHGCAHDRFVNSSPPGRIHCEDHSRAGMSSTRGESSSAASGQPTTPAASPPASLVGGRRAGPCPFVPLCQNHFGSWLSERLVQL